MRVVEALPDSYFVRRVRDAITGYRIRTKRVRGAKLRIDKRYSSKFDMRQAGNR